MRYSLFLIFLLLFVLFKLSNQTPIVNGEEYSAWEAETSLPYAAASNQSLMLGNKIFNLGGGNSSLYRSDILSNEIMPDGHLSSWVGRGSLPYNVTWFSISSINNRFYILGGAVPAPFLPLVNSTNRVFYVELDQNGDVPSWTQTSDLPQNLARGGSFIYKNKIYYIGGLIHNPVGPETVVDSAYRANILSDGSLSNWESINQIPSPRAEFGTILSDNYIYILGGMDNNSIPSSTVFRGQIDENNGDISWTTGFQMLEPLRRPSALNYGDRVYLIGGYNGTVFTKDTYVGQIDKNTHDITNWYKTGWSLNHGQCCSPAVGYKGHLYLIGGHDGSNYYSDVFRSDIEELSTFPNYKQADLLWGNVEYDTASMWSPGKTGISRWGCALTSAAMILSYHGHIVNPKELNTWLLANDGYVMNGVVDWSAITKFAKLSHETNNSLPKLEYKRFEGFNQEILDTELYATRPAIVKVFNPLNSGSHFVVVNGKDNTDYLMSDPGTSENQFSFYSSYTPQRIETFVPSNTDLSYLYLFIDSRFTLTVVGPNNNLITNGYSTEDPFIDQLDLVPSSQNKLLSFAYPKPPNGQYTVRIKGNGKYVLLARKYDREAVLTKFSPTGEMSNKQTDTYVISLDNPTQNYKIDYGFLKNEVKAAYERKDIATNAQYKLLLGFLESSQKQYLKGKTAAAKLILFGMEIDVNYSWKITKDCKTKLKSYISYLIESL